ncbi:hypothetical protein [Rhodococcus opacus]|uniref:hypothetical protein n=1 Tax=Rhodococcus opacus TaxID=37919 RepID=UPI0012DB7109
MHLVDLSDTVCDETICRVAEGDILTVHDSQHLSATTAHGLIAHWTGSSEQPTRWW